MLAVEEEEDEVAVVVVPCFSGSSTLPSFELFGFLLATC